MVQTMLLYPHCPLIRRGRAGLLPGEAGEMGIARLVKLIRILTISASTRVGHRGAEGQPVAFAEQFIDEVNRPPAVARRTAGAERCFETRIF